MAIPSGAYPTNNGMLPALSLSFGKTGDCFPVVFVRFLWSARACAMYVCGTYVLIQDSSGSELPHFSVQKNLASVRWCLSQKKPFEFLDPDWSFGSCCVTKKNFWIFGFRFKFWIMLCHKKNFWIFGSRFKRFGSQEIAEKGWLQGKSKDEDESWAAAY